MELAVVTKKELDGPDAKGHWIRILREGSPLPKPDLISLAEAEKRLGCAPDTLLDKGAAGDLDIYAPVTCEGMYVWPVTDRGIPFTSLAGSLDGVEPLFQIRLDVGAYAILTVADLKKIKLGFDVKPLDFVLPTETMRCIEEWMPGQQQEPSTVVVSEKIKSRAKQVAWVPAFPSEIVAHVVRRDMLRIIDDDFQRLKANIGLAGVSLMKTGDMCDAFEQYLGGKRADKPISDWKGFFSDVKRYPDLLDARAKTGKGGKDPIWYPVLVGLWLHKARGYGWGDLNRAFSGVALDQYLDAWVVAATEMGNEDAAGTRDKVKSARNAAWTSLQRPQVLSGKKKK